MLAGLPVMLLCTLMHAPADDQPGKEPSTARLVSFDQLQEQLGSDDLRILDARPRSAYAKGHIPGAIPVDVAAAEALAGRPAGLKDETAWERWIEPLGIGPKTRVVVVDGSRQLSAARVWWFLTYLGVPDAGLLDGNYSLWEQQGRPTSSEPTTVEPRRFDVTLREDRSADREEVLAAIKSGESQVVDARSLAEHTGEAKMSKRAGRIPDACHVEWKQLVDEQGRFLRPNALKATMQAAGVVAGKPAISHCQGGGRASVDAFVLERLGIPTQNYYAGWSDWGNVDETPVESGDPTTPRRK